MEALDNRLGPKGLLAALIPGAVAGAAATMAGTDPELAAVLGTSITALLLAWRDIPPQRLIRVTSRSRRR